MIDNRNKLIFRGARAVTSALATPRISLFFISVILKLGFTSFTGDPYAVNPGKAVLGIVTWGAWFAVLWLVALPQTDIFLARWAERLKKASLTVIALLIFIGLSAAGLFVGLKNDMIKPASFSAPIDSMLSYFKTQPRYSDGAAMAQQATENFIKGENPYSEANIVTAMEEFDGEFAGEGPFVNLTPLQEGRFADTFPYPTQEELDELWVEARETPAAVPAELESSLCYPAGSFLLAAPFAAAGISNLQVIVIIFLAAAVAFGLWRSPRQSRWIFLLAVATSLELWIGGLIGLEKRLLVLPFMLAGWLLVPKHPCFAMAFMGVAAATYQTAWFLVPFAAIYAYHQWGLKKAAAGLGCAGGVFLAVNLPFIAADPGLWLSSIMAPMLDPIYPLGVGLVSLVETGIMNVQSSALFTALEIAALTAGLWWYFKNGRRYPATGLLLSVLPVFFAWRSLGTYFYYVDIILLAMILIEYNTQRPARTLVIAE